MAQLKFHKMVLNNMTTADVISIIKYHSNLDHCQSADDMQRALEEIHDLLETEFPDIPEDGEDAEEDDDNEFGTW
jgi:hypothetical protein